MLKRKLGRARDNSLPAVIAGAVACLAWTAARAETGNTEQGAVEEVVVTAQKRSERLVDVPISVTVVDAAQLENAGIEGFQDIDKVAVGTRINRVGIHFQPSIRA